MKIQFESNLDYQLQAIEAVCDLFRGQEICRTEFTVTQNAVGGQQWLAFASSELGVGNRLTLLDDELLQNLNEVQLRNSLPVSEMLASGDFTVEMETGTGKTYVYLRTVFELNKRYGFTKFVVVVPSVAIKEGVYKTLQSTEEHFKELYAGEPFDYFLYDSSKLGQVRNYATSAQIQIMVVTVGAINKRDVNNLYKESEKTGGEKPIDLIKATRPVVIVDEPQSVDGGLSGAGKMALQAMNPLCSLRYSATHVDKHHMVYRLDAVDAYERKLVKQIEVAAATLADAHNKPYVRLVSVESRRGNISAKIELDVQSKNGIRRQVVVVRAGDHLEQHTNRAVYADCRIGEICVAKKKQSVELLIPGGEKHLQPEQSWGDVDATAVQREMIRRTIREHFDKEKRLRPQGIKVLSLFFIDEVAKYRQYAGDGKAIKGDYAKIFEEEFRRAAKLPEYARLFVDLDLTREAEDAHNGYFSIDRKGVWTNTEENNQGNRDSAERAYSLIMKDKELLLSFETPLRFIFSHSALKEGWDNPNIFQICTLRDIQHERERRQTIGRGLRLCVNQKGERLRGFQINTLTVIAMESYEKFAENLQREIEEGTGIRFGVVEDYQFAALQVASDISTSSPLGVERSKELCLYFKAVGYIDAKGRVQDSLRMALKEGTFVVPVALVMHLGQIAAALKKVAGRLEIKNADERRRVRTRRAVLHSAEFKALWQRIKQKTTYRMQFDNERLLESCTRALTDAPPISKTRLRWRKAEIAIGQAGVEASEREGAATVILQEDDIELPDLLTDLQDRTQLTRRTIQRVLNASGRLDDFQRNPQQFIQVAAEAINRCKALAVVDGIKYQRLSDEHFYAQELFEQEELTGYFRNLVDVQKSVYEQVVYDSDTEKTFADQLEKTAAVKVYAKLPGWFRVPTPLGSYNPDWAVLIEENGSERLYLVVETKGSAYQEDLREKERAKVKCGAAHFGAIRVGDDAATYLQAQSLDEVLMSAALK